MATGTLFHVKHWYAEAYEALKVPPPASLPWAEARLSPSELVARGLVGPEAPLALAIPLVLGLAVTGLRMAFGRRAPPA